MENYDDLLKAMEHFIITQEIRNKERIKIKNKKGSPVDPRLWNITQLHTIAIIKKKNKVNNALLTNSLNISRAAVTKIIKKLLSEKIIDEIMLADNKKEKYYTLTESGAELALAHEQVHGQIVKKYINVFKKFSGEELKSITRFLNEI
ncbi:MarR family transcriptional regulator [Geobacter sp. AOG2]|uniref:MarR family transcriptional regulator n=1 Tax=Geobacter sp. AOG2 TaxID=1566347 RepID=UPI001CC5B49F|nr:MarR family transcriptional regulator [Geobacter sp. AOG2]